MREYETVFILPPNLKEESIAGTVSEVKDFLLKSKARIIQEINWKKRRFAYPIKKFNEGHYYIIKFETGNTSLPVELERFYRMNENIIRFMTVKI